MSKQKVVITVGICTGGTIRTETVASLVSALINLARMDMAPNILFQIGGYVDVNRNKIVKEAHNRGTTHLMFLDADMIFPEDAMYQLLKADKDIIGGNYNSRLDPTSKEISGPTVKMLVKGKPVSLMRDGLPEGLFKCYAVPTGFMMIKMSVFDKLKKPYFESLQTPAGLHTTEDVEFCRRANKSGIEVWCDPDIKIGHIGSYVY